MKLKIHKASDFINKDAFARKDSGNRLRLSVEAVKMLDLVKGDKVAVATNQNDDKDKSLYLIKNHADGVNLTASGSGTLCLRIPFNISHLPNKKFLVSELQYEGQTIYKIKI